MARLRKILVGLAVLFVLIQFIPVNRSNPPVLREVEWDSAETRALAVRACYDCHSNETVWPTYSYVAPASFLIAKHVKDGRNALNFSEWDREQYANVTVGVIEVGFMPLPNYLPLHPEARLTEAEKAQLIEGIKKTYAADPPLLRDELSGEYDH